MSRRFAAGSNTRVAPAAMASDNIPPSGKPTSTFSREVPRSLTVQLLLDGSGGEEEHLVGRHRRSEQRDRVIPVGGRGFGVGDRGPITWCASTDQSGCSMKTATAKTIRLSPSRPVTFSMIENPTRQTTIHTANAATGIHNRTDVAGQLQCQRNSADLGRHRHQVDEERCTQVRGGRTWAQSFPDDLEGGPPADRGHPAGHLRVQADPEHADWDHPGQCQSEP